jgi:DNA-binding NarL/FixJ family response regulator
MPEMSGLEATRQIRQLVPQTDVLIFTVHESETLVRDVLSAGAHGYILKADASTHLVAAIEAVAQNDLYLSQGVSKQLVKSFAGDHRVEQPENIVSTSELSAREIEIARLLAEGKSNKEIAGKLFISVRMVETQRRTIFTKLDIHSVAELVRYAIRTGLISA